MLKSPLTCLSSSAFYLIVDLCTITDWQVLRDHLFLANEIENQRLHNEFKLTQQASNKDSRLYLDIL